MEIILSEQEKDVLVAKFSGRLDTPASGEAAAAVQPLIDSAEKTIILDCGDLTYISSSGLRIFLSIRKAAASKGGRVIIRGINNEIRQIFVMTGFLNLFEVEGS
ncbi:MAG: STAS domain-containing protein [Bacteroidales bacterium]|jgi:anti-sigma B factor antagonist|nr:STAS domain-containing protein [Bacteroidales bacterium]MBR6933502.1 STAS domain-containing protein [Bacteroidales bacterium]